MTNENPESKPKFVQLELFSGLKSDYNDNVLGDDVKSENEIKEDQIKPNDSQESFDNFELSEEDNKNDEPQELTEIEETTNDNIVISITSTDGLSIGDKLKNARLSQNRSIEDIAQATRIRNDFIECIEENDFSKLPTAAIFTKSFIKSLCREYNLNPDDIISEFEKIVSNSNSVDINSTKDSSTQIKNFRRHDTETTLLRKKTSLKFAWIITLLIFCIAIITLIYVVKSRKSINTPEILQLNTNNKFISEEVLEQFIIPEQLELMELDMPLDNGDDNIKKNARRIHEKR